MTKNEELELHYYNIIIKTRFSAIHRWPECDIAEVSYLKNPHRHEFHVTAKVPVNHDNRHIEFIQLKNKVNQFIRKNWEEKDLGHMSCEMMCRKLAAEFPIMTYVQILEDGENGAEWYKLLYTPVYYHNDLSIKE